MSSIPSIGLDLQRLSQNILASPRCMTIHCNDFQCLQQPVKSQIELDLSEDGFHCHLARRKDFPPFGAIHLLPHLPPYVRYPPPHPVIQAPHSRKASHSPQIAPPALDDMRAVPCANNSVPIPTSPENRDQSRFSGLVHLFHRFTQ